jgi:hypothetical protein
VHGPYTDSDLDRLLRWLKPDVVWFPALWPETYCYTLSACLLGGWPVVATNIGAFPERLATRPWSWLVPWQNTAADWLEFFVKIRQRHFCTLKPPAPPMPVLPQLPVSALPQQYPMEWYTGPYLSELPAPKSNAFKSDEDLLLAPEFERIVSTHFRSRTEGAIAQNARGFTLRVLARARSHPMLSGVARVIPEHWQRRVKNWLSK